MSNFAKYFSHSYSSYQNLLGQRSWSPDSCPVCSPARRCPCRCRSRRPARPRQCCAETCCWNKVVGNRKMELAKTTTIKCRRFFEDFERFLCYLMLGQLSQASPTPSLSLSIWSLFFLFKKRNEYN